MDRRSVLRYLGVASAAAMVLPSCVGDPKKASVALNNLQISGDDEELLASFAAALIPATDTPGAREVDAHLYAFIMVDDCLAPEDREKFLTGMRSFDKEVKSLTGKSFVKASQADKTDLIREIHEKQKDLPEAAGAFYRISRDLIIDGYTTSQFFLTEIREYKLVPGPVFKGCTALSANDLKSAS